MVHFEVTGDTSSAGAQDVYFRNLFDFKFTRPISNPRFDTISFPDSHRTDFAMLVDQLINHPEVCLIGSTHENLRVKNEVQFSLNGMCFYVSSLELGNEAPESIPYLVVMPDGHLYRGWNGSQQILEKLPQTQRLLPNVVMV